MGGGGVRRWDSLRKDSVLRSVSTQPSASLQISRFSELLLYIFCIFRFMRDRERKVILARQVFEVCVLRHRPRGRL